MNEKPKWNRRVPYHELILDSKDTASAVMDNFVAELEADSPKDPPSIDVELGVDVLDQVLANINNGIRRKQLNPEDQKAFDAQLQADRESRAAKAEGQSSATGADAEGTISDLRDQIEALTNQVNALEAEEYSYTSADTEAYNDLATNGINEPEETFAEGEEINE